ncbi:dephospho-CoA kinase [Periweissella cryptocerci]|uniref:Dephospho-CoA kinase n=1 Tax=Periweissella cryptocerci TaxID=2506420 RepID=A0A4P6YRP2_9LACO|nr:dephospho-CoA kinase [Periweissella cryptocerci]QBO35291.1 dephospho-CoA kinase [Periweissella cryptocerci]
MIIIGLTGGIASGKSTVSNYLREKGLTIIDADIVAREVVEPGQPALAEIVTTFGPAVLHADNTLNRQALGAIVFGHQTDLDKLNAIIQPFIHQRIEKLEAQYRAAGAKVIVLDAPVLIEAGYRDNVDLLVVVNVTSELQLQRLMQRDALDSAAAKQRIQSQLALAEKVKLADVVIDNSQSIAATKRQIDELLTRLDTLA